MDLATLDTKKGSEEGFEFQVTHPKTGEPLEIWITVQGMDSEQFQSTIKAQQRKRMDRLTRRKAQAITPDEIEAEGYDLLATITIGWRTGEKFTLDGQPFPAFSKAAAKQLYARFRWIREQVDEAMGDRANFLPKSATA